MLSAPSLQMHSMPPRITEKSCRLRVSNRTMVGVLQPPRVACVASGPKASNHQVMKTASKNCRLPWSVRSTSRIQSLSRSQIGLDANHHIHRLLERPEGNLFLDIPSHRTRRRRLVLTSRLLASFLESITANATARAIRPPALLFRLSPATR